MAEIRAVFFDFGGVLARMLDDLPRLKLAEQCGVSLSLLDHLVYFSESEKKASIGEITEAMHWEAVGKAAGIAPVDLPGLIETYYTFDVNRKLLDYIRQLRPRYKVGLLSNAWDELRQKMHGRWEIDEFFDVMIISSEVGMVKPDPRIFHLALAKLGVQAEEAIFIDDTQANVEAAIREGLAAIRFINTEQTLAELQSALSTD